MKNSLSLMILTWLLFPVSGYTKSPLPPSPKVMPFEMKKHGDTRIDDFYWMRNREDPFTIEHLKRENCIRRPFILIGHSMGAHLANRALARLPGSLQDLCRLFVPSASIGPNVLRDKGYGFRSGMSDDELWGCTVKQGGVMSELADNSSFRDFLLPTLRSDFRICEGLRAFEDIPVLDVPLRAMGGHEDSIVPSEIEDWCRVSRKPNGYHILPVKHFYFLGSEDVFFNFALNDVRELK